MFSESRKHNKTKFLMYDVNGIEKLKIAVINRKLIWKN